MEIIDPHHHLWDLTHHHYPWNVCPDAEVIFGRISQIRHNYLVEDFKADHGRQRVAKSVHIQADYDPADPAGETRWLQSVADAPASRGFPQGIVAGADFTDQRIEQVLEGHCRFANTRGIRQILNRHDNSVYNHADRDYLKDTVWRKNFGMLAKYGLSFDLQLYCHQVPDAVSLARANEGVQIILNHTGMPVDRDEASLRDWREQIKSLAACPNAAVKISGFGMVERQWTAQSIRPFVMHTLDCFGVDRCMFASNFPVDKLMRSYDQVWDAFKRVTQDLTERDRTKLFHDNAARLYRL